MTELRSVFDGTYAHFWEEELRGDRLESDVRRIHIACRLRPGMCVLDLGCAYGRIANRLATDGLIVTGLDQSSELLELARSQAGDPTPTYVEGDMRSLPAAGEFDAILLWFSTFGYFGDEENQTVLHNAFDALRPGGLLAIETRNWDRLIRDFDSWSVRRRGRDLLVEHHRFVPSSGRQETHQTLIVGGRRCERSYFIRRYTGAELTGMLRAAGFAEVMLHGEDMSPLTVDHRRVIAVGVRRGP